MGQGSSEALVLSLPGPLLATDRVNRDPTVWDGVLDSPNQTFIL